MLFRSYGRLEIESVRISVKIFFFIFGLYDQCPVSYTHLDVYKRQDYKIAGGMKYKRLADDQIGYVYYGSFSSGVGENNLSLIHISVRNRHTTQGYAHESAWSRRQAWGIYGLMLCYRETSC